MSKYGSHIRGMSLDDMEYEELKLPFHTEMFDDTTDMKSADPDGSEKSDQDCCDNESIANTKSQCTKFTIQNINGKSYTEISNINNENSVCKSPLKSGKDEKLDTLLHDNHNKMNGNTIEKNKMQKNVRKVFETKSDHSDLMYLDEIENYEEGFQSMLPNRFVDDSYFYTRDENSWTYNNTNHNDATDLIEAIVRGLDIPDGFPVLPSQIDSRSHDDLERERNQLGMTNDNDEKKLMDIYLMGSDDISCPIDKVNSMEVDSRSVQNIIDGIDPLNDIETNTLLAHAQCDNDSLEQKFTDVKAPNDHENTVDDVAFNIWKEKHRELVSEEYPDSDAGQLEDHLRMIWGKVPEKYRKKYYTQANRKMKSRKNKRGRCNSRIALGIQRITSKLDGQFKKTTNPEVVKPKAVELPNTSVEPKAVKPPNTSEQKGDEEGMKSNNFSGNNDAGGYSLDFVGAIKETVVYNSSDKNVKKRSTKRKRKSLEISNEEIETAIKNDLMIGANFDDTDAIEENLDTMNFDITELDKYLTGQEIFVDGDAFLESELKHEQEMIEKQEIEKEEKEKLKAKRRKGNKNRRGRATNIASNANSSSNKKTLPVNSGSKRQGPTGEPLDDSTDPKTTEKQNDAVSERSQNAEINMEIELRKRKEITIETKENEDDAGNEKKDSVLETNEGNANATENESISKQNDVGNETNDSNVNMEETESRNMNETPETTHETRNETNVNEKKLNTIDNNETDDAKSKTEDSKSELKVDKPTKKKARAPRQRKNESISKQNDVGNETNDSNVNMEEIESRNMNETPETTHETTHETNVNEKKLNNIDNNETSIKRNENDDAKSKTEDSKSELKVDKPTKKKTRTPRQRGVNERLLGTRE